MNYSKSLISTLIVILTGILIVFGGTFSAMAAEGEVINLKSTTHTLGTIDEKSQTTVISMGWEKPTSPENCTLAGYNFKFSVSADDTVIESSGYPATTTGTDSSSFTGKDGEGYYFHIKAVFIDSTTNEDDWGPQITKGPYYIDDTAPLNPFVSINSGESSTNSISVTLTLGATNATQMKISNTSVGTGRWENYATSTAWTLAAKDGNKTVHVLFKDNAENIIGQAVNDTINFATEDLLVSEAATTVTMGATLSFTAFGGTEVYTSWNVVEEKDKDGNDANAGDIAEIVADPSDNTKGILTPVGAGTCKVRVTDQDSATADSSVITVTLLSISPSTATVANMQSQQFTADNGTVPLTWSITEGGAGTINSSTGLFTADAGNTGEETITVTDANGITAAATVTVAAASIEVTAGADQPDVMVGTAATDLEVKVTEGGVAAANYVIDFSITADPNTGDYVKGSFSDGSETLTSEVLTSGEGIASTSFFVGQKAGTYTVSAACTKKDNDGTLGGDTTDVPVTNSPRAFTITGTAGDADKIEYFSGGGQTGTPDTPLSNPFVVLVTDAYANPKLGTTVTFAVTEGTGTLSVATDVTDSNGKASTTLTPSAGTNTVTATVDNLTGSLVTFTASAGTKGDVNGDLSINYKDAIMVLQYAASLRTLTESQLALGDAYTDEIVNYKDAINILKYAAGIIDSF